MRNTYCQSLQPGDQIDIIAPGMPFNKQDVSLAIKVLEAWELKVNYPDNLLGKDLLCANTKTARQKVLINALKSSAKVIWCARGGYGSIHLIKELAKLKPPKQQKYLIGFSDITLLHQLLNQKWNWPSLHGPHIDRLSYLSKPNLSKLKKILFGQVEELIFKNLKPLNKPALLKNTVNGKIVGGNLITVQSLFGTPWQIDTNNRILFLEDIGERAYRVDRVLEHMRLLGLLSNLKAIVFGPFVGGEEPGGKKSKVSRCMKNFAESVSFPVYSGLLSGHIPNSRALPLNTDATIQKNKNSWNLLVKTGMVNEL